MTNVLVTGGAGFIGSNFVHYLRETHPEYNITVLDKLTYAGSKENLKEVLDEIQFIKGDIQKKQDVKKAMEDVDLVFNFAAESHVDRSIEGPEVFIKTNVEGTQILLEEARKQDVEKFIQISTDEVYGSIKQGSFEEGDPLDPSSPYSASKAAADLLCNAYHRTYGSPVIITRSSNNYGPRQYPEKLIPVLIKKALNDEPLPLYGDGSNVRDWIYVTDNCRAIDLVARNGDIAEIYNIGANEEYENIEVAKLVLDILDKPYELITFVEDRPGHDYRYALEISKVRKLGWETQLELEQGLQRTVQWYKEKYNW